MVANVRKISQKTKNKSLKYYRIRKMLYQNYKKVFQFRKFCFFLKKGVAP